MTHTRILAIVEATAITASVILWMIGAAATMKQSQHATPHRNTPHAQR